MSSWVRAFAVTAIALSIVMPRVSASEPPPPPQPQDGPGGQERLYPNVRQERFGERPTGFWLFEPLTEDHTVPAEPQSLVIFLHGFMAVYPELYGEWIEHIVRDGAVVIFPDYQTLNPLTLRPSEYLDNVISAVDAAVVTLEGDGRAPVDFSRTAVLGHSAGGVLSVNYAAVAAERGLPVPTVIMPVEPGGCRGCGSGPEPPFGMKLEELSTIEPSARAIVIAGADDGIVGTDPARLIWASLDSLEPGHRDLVIFQSDDHGSPELQADHFMPLERLGGEIDALDWFGTWKLFDALMSCAFDDTGCDMALGGTSFQRDMGIWSDGTPVLSPIIESA